MMRLALLFAATVPVMLGTLAFAALVKGALFAVDALNVTLRAVGL